MTAPAHYTEEELYARLHQGNPGDLELYLRACEDAGTALELGAGRGRVAIPLAQAGLRVVGVEENPVFLLEARAAWEALQESGERPRGELHLLEGDLRAVELSERFDRVLLPYNALYALGGEDGVRAALERARRHLAPNGELWLDVYAMDGFEEAERAGLIPEEELEEVAVWEDGPRRVQVFERTRVDPSARRLDVTYEARSGDELVGAQTLTHHYFESTELFEWLEDAGLEPAAIWGGFAGEPFDDEADYLIVCAVERDASDEDDEARAGSGLLAPPA